MAPRDGFLRLTLVSMAFGVWFMLTACAVLLWCFLVGPPPRAIVQLAIASGMVAVAAILVSVAGCCVPNRRQPPDRSGHE